MKTYEVGHNDDQDTMLNWLADGVQIIITAGAHFLQTINLRADNNLFVREKTGAQQHHHSRGRSSRNLNFPEAGLSFEIVF